MFKVSGHGRYLARKGDMLQFCSDIEQISREKERDWVDLLPEVFCLLKNWGDFGSQLVEILQIMSALGNTFLQEIYTKKRTWQPRRADVPLAQLLTCASQSLFVFTETLPNIYKNFQLGRGYFRIKFLLPLTNLLLYLMI